MAKDSAKACGTCTRFPGDRNNSSMQAPVKCLHKNKIVNSTTQACGKGYRPVKI